MIKKTLFILFLFISLFTKAQTTKNVLNEGSVVRAEDGNVYPYAAWRKLMSTGKYGLKSRGTVTDSGKPEYLLYELSDEQKKAYFDKMPKPRKSDNFTEGEEFAGFKATDMNGNKFDLRNAKGKVIVLNFWFINCPPCRSEIPQLNELAEQYKNNKDMIFLAIATDDRYDLKNFLKTTPFQYNIVDSGRSIAEKYNLRLYPTHVVIDKNGIIKFGTVGLASNTMHWLKKSIDESLALN